MGVKLDELVMALPRVSIPFNLGPEGFKYHVADGSQTLVTLSGILTHMQRHDEELKAQRERADKAEATVKKLGDELRQLGVKQALLLERADRIELSADKEAVRNTNAHRGAEVRIDALATEAAADRKKTSDLDAALAEVGRRAEKLEHRATTMSARLDAAAGMAPGPSSWKDDVDDVDDVVETVMALQGEVARIGAAVAVTNNLMDRTANEIMMRFPYKDEVAAMHQLAEADVPESLEDVASGVDLSLAPAAAPGAAPAPAPQGSDGESVFGVNDFLDGFGEAPAPSPFEAPPPTASAKAVTQMKRRSSLGRLLDKEEHEAALRHALYSKLRTLDSSFSHKFEDQKLGFSIALARYGDEGRFFLQVDATRPGCDLYPDLLKPHDELVAVDDELVVSADTRKFQEVLHRLLTAPRPIKLTFIEGEGRDLAFQNQERQRRLAAKSKSPKKPDPPPEAIPDQTLARLTSAMSLDSIARGLSVAFIKEDARDDDDEASRVEARHTALPWCSVSCLGADLQVLETPDATLRYDL